MEESNKDFSPLGLVKITNSKISANINSVSDAKLVIKELKLKKKEYNLVKKNVINNQKQIRTEYTNEVRTRGSMLKGGGALGKFTRGIQSVSRDNRKAKLANDLAPLERRIQEIDAILLGIDNLILQAETYILKQQSNNN